MNTITIVPLQGLYFHNLFFGQELRHTCDENNHLVEKVFINTLNLAKIFSTR
jgi:hypothetical protein